ncbi:MAG: PepSY-like domain-containing protein [Isosphaeraceae bacterium]
MTMRNRFRAALAAVLGLSAVAALAVADEEKVAFDRLPAAVKKAVKKEFHGAKVRGASKEVEHGKTSYEVELTVEGHSIDVVMNARGKILEVEKQIPVGHLPGAVRKKLAAKYPGARIEKAERVSKGHHGPVHYEVDIRAEVVFTEQGKIVRARIEDEVGDDEESAHEGKKGKKEHHDADDDDDDDEKGEHHKASSRCEKCEKGEKGERCDKCDKCDKCEKCEKKEHHDADDDEEREHHKGSAHREKKEHGEHEHAAHHDKKKEHHDADDDDDDDDDDHRSSVKGEKKEHREHGEAHDGKKPKKEHEDRDDDDEDEEEDDD